MGSGHAPRCTDEPDHLATLHFISLFHVNPREMREQGEHPEAVIDDDNVPCEEQLAGSDIGMTGAEVRRFSFMRAVRALAPNATKADREAAAFEFEVSAAAARAYGKEAKGILVPADVLRAFNAGGAGNSPAGAQTGASVS